MHDEDTTDESADADAERSDEPSLPAAAAAGHRYNDCGGAVAVAVGSPPRPLPPLLPPGVWGVARPLVKYLAGVTEDRNHILDEH